MSTDDVASSMRISFFFESRALKTMIRNSRVEIYLAKQRSCFSPCDKLLPCSSIIPLRPPILSTLLRRPTLSTAALMSSTENFPAGSRFSAMVPLKRNSSCESVVIFLNTVALCVQKSRTTSAVSEHRRFSGRHH